MHTWYFEQAADEKAFHAPALLRYHGVDEGAHDGHGHRAKLMSRTINIILAVFAVLVLVCSIAASDRWGIVTAGTCAVLFGLLAAGVKIFRRVPRMVRGQTYSGQDERRS